MLHDAGRQVPEVRDGWVFAGVLALLFWAPLPLASNRTFAVAWLFVLALLLMLGSMWAWRRHADHAWRRVGRFRGPLALLASLSVWVWVQSLPIPPSLVSLLSPEAFRVEAGVGQPALSLDPQQTRLYAVLTVTYLMVFLVVALTVRSRERLERLAFGLVVIGLLQALYGVAMYAAGVRYQIFFLDVDQSRMRGTFGNPNHFAGFMEMTLSIGVGLMLAQLGDGHGRWSGWRHALLSAFEFALSRTLLLRLLLVIMVIALVLSHSRMGNTAFFVSMLLVGGVALLRGRRARPTILILLLSLIVVDLLVVGSWVGLSKVVERFESKAVLVELSAYDDHVEDRGDVYKYALDVIRDFPVTGTGAGSFYEAYPRYRAQGTGYFDHAHNDYVEFLTDFGIIGFVFFAWLVLSSFIVAARSFAMRRSPLSRGMALGVMMAMVSIAIHSTVDFNLQIPANALTMVVILAMAWVVHALPSSSKSGGDVA